MAKFIRTALLAAAVLASGGCVPAVDVFGEPGAGYVADAAALTASADWSNAETVTVSLSEFAFAPTSVTFRARTPYRLVIKNTGGQTHFFVSDGFFRAIAARTLRSADGEIENPYLEKIAVAPGATKELLFIAVNSGTYELACTAFLHETFGMTGRISVR